MGFHEKTIVYPVVWSITGPSGATAFVLDENGQKVAGLTGRAVTSNDAWEAQIKHIHISS